VSKPLSEILSDGTLVDNTIHQVRGGLFSAGHQREPLTIHDGIREKNAYRAWRFLLKASSTLNERLRSVEKSTVVMLAGKDGEYEHNTQDDFLRMDSGSDHTDFAFSTGNLIGCATGEAEGYKYSLRVSSRFGDEFLKYIIADADGFAELPDHGGVDKGDYDWLLVFLWLVKLKRAFRLGLPKAYETRKEPLTQVRGRLDPVDYFLNQERARYRCTYREHSYDNETTRLIARTLQHLDSDPFLQGAHTLSQTFQIATRGRHIALQELLATPPARNPYYADYNPVIALSKQILRSELSDFGDQSQTSAFFFDVSMLFEYFVRKLLKRAGVTLRVKNNQTWAVPTGRKLRSLVPDLVFEIDGAAYVFDVKYKSFDFREGVKREDVFQLHTYVGQLANEAPVAGCGFIYPILESRWNANGLESSGGILTDSFTQGGRTIPFHVCFLKVPDHDDAVGRTEFYASFKCNCAAFVRGYLAALGQSSAMAA
jgi:5-methylcytosine-specific restriction enzyme subunit McrC